MLLASGGCNKMAGFSAQILLRAQKPRWNTEESAEPLLPGISGTLTVAMYSSMR